jgi:hypothetical protein
MPRKSDTGMAFLDLMLCAIGCALMIFTAQIPQSRGRGRGWDDKPLVVYAQASGMPELFLDGRLGFRWELQREGGLAGQGTVVPADGSTANGSWVTFVVPEAEFGRWTLALTVVADRGGAGGIVEEINRAGVPLTHEIADLKSHLLLYQRYLTLRQQRADRDELSAFRAAVKPPIAESHGGLDLGEARGEVTKYLRYRQLVMQAALAARFGPAEAREHEAELDELVDSLKGPVPEPRLDRVRLGILAEEELRLEPHRPGPHWAALTKTIADIKTFPAKDGWRNGWYIAYLNEFIRLRARQEHGIGEGTPDAVKDYAEPLGSSYKEGLAKTAELGCNDLLFRILAEEIRALSEGDPLITVHYGVAWGDNRWPDSPGPPDDELPPPVFSAQFPPRLRTKIPLAGVRLSANQAEPVVLTDIE